MPIARVLSFSTASLRPHLYLGLGCRDPSGKDDGPVSSSVSAASRTGQKMVGLFTPGKWRPGYFDFLHMPFDQLPLLCFSRCSLCVQVARVRFVFDSNGSSCCCLYWPISMPHAIQNVPHEKNARATAASGPRSREPAQFSARASSKFDHAFLGLSLSRSSPSHFLSRFPVSFLFLATTTFSPTESVPQLGCRMSALAVLNDALLRQEELCFSRNGLDC